MLVEFQFMTTVDLRQWVPHVSTRVAASAIFFPQRRRRRAPPGPDTPQGEANGGNLRTAEDNSVIMGRT